MRVDAVKNSSTGKVGSEVMVAGATDSAGTIDSAVLDRLDIGLFKALRKLDTPKQRVCSALWLSYAEYDELSRLI